MVLSTNVVSLIFILEFLYLVTNTGAGHHAGHHASHHGNHGHHSGHDSGHYGRHGNSHFGGGVGKHSRYGYGGIGRRLDQGHVGGGGPRDQVPSMHRSGGKKSLNPVGYLNSENQHQPRVSAHSKKKGHADIVHSQMTSRDVNSVTLPNAASKFT